MFQKTSWQRVVRKTDPVVDLEEFLIGDTAPSADVREVVEKEFEDKPYRVAMMYVFSVVLLLCVCVWSMRHHSVPGRPSHLQ